ncbi:hypothetical protein PSYPI_39449, partial [Pseudomonas syringae pv. pisi str. 1704B]
MHSLIGSNKTGNALQPVALWTAFIEQLQQGGAQHPS